MADEFTVAELELIQTGLAALRHQVERITDLGNDALLGEVVSLMASKQDEIGTLNRKIRQMIAEKNR